MSPGPNPIYRIGLDVCCNTGAEAQLNGHRWNNVRRMDALWKSHAQKRLRGGGWWFESRTKGATGSASGQLLIRAGEYNRDDQVLG